MINKFIHSKLFKQIFRFGIVGFTAFLIDAGLLYVLTEFCHIHYLISSIISFTVSLAYNYILSIFWVFDVKRKQTIKEVAVFVILSIFGLGINQLVMYLGVDLLHIYYMLCKILATGIVMVYNFITRKIFIERAGE